MNGEVSLIVRKTIEGGGIPQVIDSGTLMSGTSPAVPPFTVSQFQIPSSYPSALGLVGATITMSNGSGCTDVRTILYAEEYYPTTYMVTVDSLDCTYPPIAGLCPYEITLQTPTSEEYCLDLFENESISQNWRFTDLNNFQSQGAFSREFRIPMSDRNQLALGPLFDVNYSAGADNFFHYKLPAEIRVDTLPIATGYVRVRKVYQQKNRINEVELAFYAETPDLFKAIGEKKLADLASLNDLNEIINYDAVTTLTSDRLWTLIDRGQLWSEGGQTGTRHINNATHPVYAYDLTPAVNWAYLLSKIIEEAGFELEAGSLLTTLSEYYMPWLNSSILKTDDLGYQYFFRAYNNTYAFPATSSGATSAFIPYVAAGVAFDNNSAYDPTTSTYTAPGGGRYTFQFTFQMSTTGYTGFASRTALKVYAVVNGIEQYLSTYYYSDDQTINFIYGFDLEITDTITFGFRYEIQTSTGATSGTATVVIAGSSGGIGQSNIEIIGTRFNYGQNIRYALNAPDMRQIDFVNDVVKMHNCMLIADRTNPNKIALIPYNSYVGSGNVVDWTQKLDIDKDITTYSTVELQKSKTTFSYTAGEDYLSQQYKQANRVYGDYKAEGYTVNPDTEPSTFISGDNTVQLITRSTPCGLIDGTTFAIPQFINLNNQFVIPGPRALYATTTTIPVNLYNDNTSSAAVITPVLQLCNYSSAAPDVYDFDLNWAPEVPPFPIGANPYNNLFNQWWRNAFNELYSPDARIMEASFALDLSDILTFQFSDVIWINNAQWRILEINDYKVGGFESTKVKLIKYLDSEADCTSLPSFVNVNGTVQFMNASGDPVSPTQSCCTRYGYTWSESQGECYAFNETNNRPDSGITGNQVNRIDRGVVVPPATNGNTGTTASGVAVRMASGNNNSLAVGDTLEVTEAVRGNVMLGKNVYTNLPGLHLGGGFTSDNRANNAGSRQYGVFIQGFKNNLASAGSTINFTIEDKANAYIELPNNTHLMCLVSVNVYDFGTDKYHSTLHHVFLKKVGAVATASAVTTLNTINSFPSLTLTLSIDTATNTAQHRFVMTAGGSGFPYQVQATMSIQYTQIR